MVAIKHKYVHHDTPTKCWFIGAVKAGLSIQKSAALTGIPPTTAQHIFKKYATTGSTSDLPRSGCPPKLTEADKRQLVRNAIKDCRKPFSELVNTIPTKVSISTIRNVLSEKGDHWRIAKKVPFINARQKKARLAWAKEYEQWGQREWHWVIFSNESYIYLGDRSGRVYVTRKPGEELDENCVVP
ncbi:hypothetical protein AB1N83_014349 [Pleurotus pulmonarius]